MARKQKFGEETVVLTFRVPVSKVSVVKANVAALCEVKGLNDRSNHLINAARGRESSGVNEDEGEISVKLPPKSTTSFSAKPKEGKPERLPGEDAVDYAGRVSLWKKSLL